MPGFAAGGLVPTPETSALDLPDISMQVVSALRSIPVVLDMFEVRDANDRLDVLTETTEV